MTDVDLSRILSLPVSERISLVQQIWDSVAADADAVPVTAEQQEELERRLDAYDRQPDDVVEWSEVRERLRARPDN